jgi:hypothetical protein
VQIRLRRLAVLGSALLLGASLSSCGSSSGYAASPGSFTISPSATDAAPGAGIKFQAVQGSTGLAVAWAVEEAHGGTIDANGNYTAPSTEGTYHVVATTLTGAGAGATVSVYNRSTGEVAAPATSGGTAITQMPSNGTTPWAPSPSDPTWVNVVNYGAKGDGLTDDTAAFQKAAATGKQVFVPKPSSFYLLSGPISMQNTIAGDGNMPQIKMGGANGDSGHQILRYVNQSFASMAYVQGLSLDGRWNGTTTPGGEYAHCIVIAGTTNVTVRYNALLNPMGDCVMIGGDPGRGGSSNPSNTIYVLNNTLDNPYRCNVAALYATNYWIQNNAINKYNSYVTAIDNEPNPDGVTSDNNATITNNVFDCQHTACVMLYHFPNGYPASGVAGDNITVSGNSGQAQRGYEFTQTGNWTNVTVTGNSWN